MRAVVIELRELDVADPTETLRVGSVVMARSCIATFRAKGDASPGWLWSALRAGGQWSAIQCEFEQGDYRQARAERSAALREQLAAVGVRL